MYFVTLLNTASRDENRNIIVGNDEKPLIIDEFHLPVEEIVQYFRMGSDVAIYHRTSHMSIAFVFDTESLAIDCMDNITKAFKEYYANESEQTARSSSSPPKTSFYDPYARLKQIVANDYKW